MQSSKEGNEEEKEKAEGNHDEDDARWSHREYR